MEEFENLKQEELKKLQKERKIADRQNKAMANVPNRKEREEIENLKKQVGLFKLKHYLILILYICNVIKIQGQSSSYYLIFIKILIFLYSRWLL